MSTAIKQISSERVTGIHFPKHIIDNLYKGIRMWFWEQGQVGPLGGNASVQGPVAKP
jgi:hypothetical protein